MRGARALGLPDLFGQRGGWMEIRWFVDADMVHDGGQKTPRRKEYLRATAFHRRIALGADGNRYAISFCVRIGRLTLTLFVVLQIADGLMTFGAVRIFGTVAERNPILETWIQLAGPGAALLGAKGIACAGAVVLYVFGRQKTLAALTGALLACGVLPWLAVLATFP